MRLYFSDRLIIHWLPTLARDIFTKLFITRKPKLKKYRVLRTDFGREFTSSKGYLKSVGTIWIGNKGGQNKSPILGKWSTNYLNSFNKSPCMTSSERFVKTLKTKIFNRVQASNKPLSQWWQFLSDSVSSYNSSVHSFHNMEPNKVYRVTKVKIVLESYFCIRSHLFMMISYEGGSCVRKERKILSTGVISWSNTERL